jgi:hypothetical protein
MRSSRGRTREWRGQELALEKAYNLEFLTAYWMVDLRGFQMAVEVNREEFLQRKMSELYHENYRCDE